MKKSVLKKAWAVIVAICIALSFAANVAAAESSDVSADMSENAYQASFIMYETTYYVGQEINAEVRLIYYTSDGMAYTSLVPVERIEGYDPYTIGSQTVTLY